MNIPQADDVGKLQDIPLAIASGLVETSDIANRYGFVKRQAQYYLEASEMLGFVVRNQGKYSLTPLGRRYVDLTFQERKTLMVTRMLLLPVIQRIVVELFVSRDHLLEKEQLGALVSTRANISGSTIMRRSHTLLEWFSWLGKETGVFETTRHSLRITVGSGEAGR